MNVTWVKGFPTGHETGSFLTVDLGGSNLRVCWITLKGGQGETHLCQDSFAIPDEIKTGNAEELWGVITQSLEDFIKKHDIKTSDGKP